GCTRSNSRGRDRGRGRRRGRERCATWVGTNGERTAEVGAFREGFLCASGAGGQANRDGRPAIRVVLRGTVSAFLDAVARGTLVVDGAMGTQLYERGVLFTVNYEELNLSRPDLVRKIHEEYVRAGANVVETNTFGANPTRLARHGLEAKVREINAAGV